MRVEIAGALACGKTTLSSHLATLGYHVVSEDLTRNPYLELRKQDPEKYDLLCQQRFIEDKIESLKSAVDSGEARIVSDYCMAAERAYVTFYLGDKPHWIDILERMIDGSDKEIGSPDAVIYLQCRPQTQLARIRARGRAFEQDHDIAFLETINALVDEKVAAIRDGGTPVLEFSSEAIASDPKPVEAALARIGFQPVPARSVEGPASAWKSKSPAAQSL